MHILAIETSCDETAAAILRDGREILSSIVASQIKVHSTYGGVVPELASREHIKSISYVVKEAFKEAGLGYEQIDGIAVTQGPGLIGSLLVGLSYAKAMAYALKIPLVPVNHIEGHIYSAFLEHSDIQYPLLALVVSGGHTALYFSRKPEKYKIIGKTRDDAAGEAFDKVAKLLGLGYPGGPIIDRLAEKGNPKGVKLAMPKIKESYSGKYAEPGRRLDFSFSGIKTAVLRYVQQAGMQNVGARPENLTKPVYDLIASFQRVVVDTLLDRTRRAVEATHPASVILTGGVACNRWLRAAFQREFAARGLPVYYPSPRLTTDNAAMIAAAGYPKLQRLLKSKKKSGDRSALLKLDLDAYANLKLVG
jgi:N6-L-threonylcarbamoyladenine synthase